MAGGGTIKSSLLLGTHVALLGMTGAFAARWAIRRPALWALRVALALLAWAIAGYVLALAGTEPVIVKYDRVFSALQFLLSRDREGYATGAELLGRYAVLHLAAVVATTTIHVPVMRWAAKTG